MEFLIMIISNTSFYGDITRLLCKVAHNMRILWIAIFSISLLGIVSCDGGGVGSASGLQSPANIKTIAVTSDDVNLVNNLSNGIGVLLQTGVNINNNGPQFYVSDLAALRPKLLAQAMIDARTRGLSITKAVGSKLGPVIAVTSGPVQVTAPESVDTSGGGLYDTTTIPKTVTVTVSVSFKVG